ncbi:hypothetical protein Tco_0137764 [Tanacetum coccineum]
MFPLPSQQVLLIWETREKLLRPQLVRFGNLRKILLVKVQISMVYLATLMIKETIVATSTTEAEYVAAASGYNNVADLLTKPFDVGRFQYLVAEHVMKRLLWCIKSGITSCCKSNCLGMGYRNL